MHNAKPSKNALESFAETIESLVVAFILAFVFRAFVVEAFVIPTGSMADTLRGAHFHLTCPQCGYTYNYSFNPQEHLNPRTNRPFYEGQVPKDPITSWPNAYRTMTGIPHCPMCGMPADRNTLMKVNNGDRILVLKYLYQFGQPKIWDAVVFKNPVEPKINYIKRLIGKPGQKVEIIDGDIYIDDAIAAKPDHVQNVLWIESYNHDYQPLNVSYLGDRLLQQRWQMPLEPDNAAAWDLERADRRILFNGSDTPATLHFNPKRLAYILAEFNAYNGSVKEPIYLSQDQQDAYYPIAASKNRAANLVSDLKLAFTLYSQNTDSTLAVTLGKYGRRYQAAIRSDGQCTLTDLTTGQVLLEDTIKPLTPNRYHQISFANVDHQLVLQVNQTKLTYTGESSPQAWGYNPQWEQSPVPTVTLSAQGQAFQIQNIILYRDIHYGRYIQSTPGRGTEGFPIYLKDNQYYVLGDNSPISGDSRFWSSPGKGNRQDYEIGTVPSEYLIGKAFFVYWPAGYSIHPKFPLALIPNAGDMRFIH